MKRVSMILLAVLILVGVVPHASHAASNVATITIFSDGSGGGRGMHSWVSIKNISSKTIYAGKLKISPNKEVTIGTWRERSGHEGVFYNMEAYKVDKKNPANDNKLSYRKRLSLSKNITQSELNKANETIVDGDYWTYTKNCSYFATKVWNSAVPSNKLSAYQGPIQTPAGLAQSIEKKSGHQYQRSIQRAEAKSVVYFDTKKKATVSAFNLSSSSNDSSF